MWRLTSGHINSSKSLCASTPHPKRLRINHLPRHRSRPIQTAPPLICIYHVLQQHSLQIYLHLVKRPVNDHRWSSPKMWICYWRQHGGTDLQSTCPVQTTLALTINERNPNFGHSWLRTNFMKSISDDLNRNSLPSHCLMVRVVTNRCLLAGST